MVVFGGAAITHRGSLHLVENQQRAILVAEPTNFLEVARLRRQHSNIHHDRLDDDRGHFALGLLQNLLQTGRIIELGDERV